MSDDFFKEKQETKMDPQAQEIEIEEKAPEAIKLGDKAYTTEELQDLVGLGEQARELESKWNTKVDRLMPEFTKSRQEIAELRKQVEDRTAQEVQQKESQGQVLSPEEVKAEAVRQLRDLMVAPELQQTIKGMVAEDRQAAQLVNDTEFVIEDYADQGLPKTTVEDLLQHMADTGIKNPDKAYKDMFEEEYAEWKAGQINSLKQPGLTTIEGSTAGGKNPPTEPITKENLGRLVAEALRGEG